MKKLSEYKNEEGLELLADILDPAVEVFSDKEVSKIFNGKKTSMAEVVKYVLKNHSESIIKILAVLNGTTPDEYQGNIVTMTSQCIALLNDEELMSFFQLQGQTEAVTTFGSATENTEATETK